MISTVLVILLMNSMKMWIYKKNMVIEMKKVLVMLIVLAVLNIPLVSAQIDFDNLKEGILRGVDSSINRLNDIEGKIESNPEISDAAKESIIDALDIVENGLISYKDKVEKATTLEELRAANQEIIKYLMDNKDVIRENIRKAIIDISEQASEKAEELKEKVEQLLKILKVTCPSEKETISELETQLQQLESEIDALEQAIQSEDTQTIKQEIKKISELSKDIANNLKKIEAACL